MKTRKYLQLFLIIIYLMIFKLAQLFVKIFILIKYVNNVYI